jgi:hypothetical protein
VAAVQEADENLPVAAFSTCVLGTPKRQRFQCLTGILVHSKYSPFELHALILHAVINYFI